MTERSGLIFCAASLLACLALAWAAFPLAALDRDVLAKYRTPQPAYDMPPIDVGGGFGELPAEELIGYYIENPPADEAALVPEIRFGGC